jgi:UDP-N-acetylmuramoyl-tripeptide--D-alanyl-D-alanine ligase
MIFPILAALSAAAVEGIDLAAAARRLGELAPLPGRMQIIPLGCGAVLIDDSFKSAIETIHASFDALEALPAQRKFLVLGDISEPPGKQGPLGRAVGERIAAIFDEALCIGRHFPLYRRGAERAGMARENVRRVDVGQAIEILRQKLGPGDVVLLKGRDNQRFDRIALGLRGRTIGCDLHYCDLRSGRCARCSLLESGWGDLPRFMKTY